jgi:hypothetical protein
MRTGDDRGTGMDEAFKADFRIDDDEIERLVTVAIHLHAAAGGAIDMPEAKCRAALALYGPLLGGEHCAGSEKGITSTKWHGDLCVTMDLPRIRMWHRNAR